MYKTMGTVALETAKLTEAGMQRNGLGCEPPHLSFSLHSQCSLKANYSAAQSCPQATKLQLILQFIQNEKSSLVKYAFES